MRTARYFVALTFVASQLVACGGGSAPDERAGGSTTPATDGRQAATDKNAHPVFPDADSGADPSVPADQEAVDSLVRWETNANFDLIGDPGSQGRTIPRGALGLSEHPPQWGPNVTEFGHTVSNLVRVPAHASPEHARLDAANRDALAILPTG